MAILKVEVEGGVIEGFPANNQSVSVFKGIPFASPPTDEYCWKRPMTVSPRKGIYEAYRYRDICTQLRVPSEGGNTLAANEFYGIDFPVSEDFLYLNV